MINAIANIIKGPQSFPTANLLMNLQNLEVVNISGTNYFKDFGPLGLNALALTTTTTNDSIALSLDSRLQTACNSAGCFAQFYNGTYPNATSAKTVLLSDLSQLYLDNYIFSNVTNKIFLIYSTEITGSVLNVVLDRVGSRINKITQWGLVAGTFGYTAGFKIPNSDIICGLGADKPDAFYNYNIETKVVESYGTITGNSTGLYFQHVLTPNGHIVGFPYNETRVCDIDPITKTVNFYGDFSANAQGRFTGKNPIILTNGDVITCPRTINTFVKYNYLTNTLTTFGTLTAGTDKFTDLVYINDTLLVTIPQTYNKVVNINPVTNQLTEYGSIGTVASKYGSYQKINDDLICCVPRNSTFITNIHPISGTVENYGTFAASAYYSSILLANGHVLCVPLNVTQILDIDPIAKTSVLWGDLGATSTKYASSFQLVLLPSGHVLAYPFNAGDILDIDPTNQIITKISLKDVSAGKYGTVNDFVNIISNNQIITIPSKTQSFIDYNPITQQYFKEMYFGYVSTEVSQRNKAIVENKRLLFFEQHKKAIIDITLR
jgi:hypothetical protein